MSTWFICVYCQELLDIPLFHTLLCWYHFYQHQEDDPLSSTTIQVAWHHVLWGFDTETAITWDDAIVSGLFLELSRLPIGNSREGKWEGLQ